MSDRELLELAAKAVKGEFSHGTTKHRTGETWDEWEWIGPQGIKAPYDCGSQYPLTDNGHALALAVHLQIDLELFEDQVWAGEESNKLVHEFFKGDPMKATRRAIVRAAAEIGKAIP